MGLFQFVKNAGAKLFGSDEKEKQASEEEKRKALENHIKRFNLRSENVEAVLHGHTVTLTGKVDTTQEKNRIVMAAGNIRGIDAVDDQIKVEKEDTSQDADKQFYTVKSGDSLSKISKEVYGDANKYNQIFEANRPMLDDPNKIYPGQVLVIPPKNA